MMHVIFWEKGSSRKLERLTVQDFDKQLYKAVARIIDGVRKTGDRALVKYTKKFDGVELSPKRLKVKEGDINKAYEQIDVKFVPLLKQAIENVRSFYKKRSKRSFRLKAKDGVMLEEKYYPIERVGIYIPGGTAPLFSTVYMAVLPAKMAGVKEITIVSPPARNGEIDPHILVVANLLGVGEIYRVGGSQAIAALALGTRSIPKVDKIVGPGNRYVTEAKRQVYGFCDVDMVAGPSEAVLLADGHANPDYVAADLLAQAEHANSTAILITTSKKLANEIKKKVDSGYAIIVHNLKEAVKIINTIAPEHLQIMVKSPSRIRKKIVNAGAIFLGAYSPIAVGDYIAGPSHILPTGGTARFYSALGIDDFIKRSHFITYSREALEKVKKQIGRLAEIEGLKLHKNSLDVRFPEPETVLAREERKKNFSEPPLGAKSTQEIKDAQKGKNPKDPQESPDKKTDH
ncbi:MAG: histidinol dehydrogenase [Candidatus Omnitrophota bacterium]|nr:histidinol dehydrogenase [Candidatus Omnitrophota bacterium]